MNHTSGLVVYVKLFSEAAVGWPTVFTHVSCNKTPTEKFENHQFLKQFLISSLYKKIFMTPSVCNAYNGFQVLHAEGKLSLFFVDAK